MMYSTPLNRVLQFQDMRYLQPTDVVSVSFWKRDHHDYSDLVDSCHHSTMFHYTMVQHSHFDLIGELTFNQVRLVFYRYNSIFMELKHKSNKLNQIR